MSSIIDQIQQLRILPAVILDKVEQAKPLAEAMRAGGLPCLEITFRTEAAEGAIKALQDDKELLIGAGTVLTLDQAKRALDAGSRFVVTPGFNPKIVQYCQDHKVPIVPGASNPTDIEMALEYGLTAVKFFPAESFGGVKTLKAFNGPYPMMRYVPTGGVNISNLKSYLEFKPVLACGGSWMVAPELIRAQNYTEITRLCREAIEAAASVGR